MGASPSRKVLLSSWESGESLGNSQRNLQPFTPNYRLVRDKLRKKVQCSIHDQQADLCDSVPILQEPPEGIQQEDVRPILQMQENQVQGAGHDSGSAKLLRVGSFR